MLAIDVCDHRDRRRELQKRPIAFVRFSDHVFAASEPRVAAERAQPSTDHRRRIEPGPLQHQRDHRRRRRLAVRARDRDAEFQTHQLREHLCARNDGKMSPIRLDDLGIVCGDRRRDDDDIGVAEMNRVMADKNTDTERRQSIGQIAAPRVGSAHRVPEVCEQFRNSTHADTANPDKMNVSRATEARGSGRRSFRRRHVRSPSVDRRSSWRRPAGRSDASTHASTTAVRRRT